MFHDLSVAPTLKRTIFNAIVCPRPIGWISTVSTDGRANLAPFSHFNMVSTAPPALMFSCNTPADRPEKDSIANCRATGEFVVNLVTEALVEPMNATSIAAPYGTDEFELAHLEKAPCTLVRAPRVAASPAAFECRVLKIVQIEPEAAGDTPSTIVIGRIIGVHVAEGYLNDKGHFDTLKARPLARLGGIQYAELGRVFELAQPFKRV